MMARSYQIAFLTVLSAGLSEARKWRDIIDHEIYRQVHLDTDRYQLKIEMDPFFIVDSEEKIVAPSPPPQTQAWITLNPTEGIPSSVPSDMPSLAPTGPTSAPTIQEQNIEGNGGCNEGTILYQVNMYDAWGDGWDGTMLKITGIEDQDTYVVSGSTVTQTHTTNTGDMTVSISKTVSLSSSTLFSSTPEERTPVDPLGLIFQGGLRQGSESSADVCLMPRRCYEVVVHGGDYLSEVSWDLRSVTLGAEAQVANPILLGGAPSQCMFSLPDENGEYFCPPSCNQTVVSAHSEIPKVLEQLTQVGTVEEAQAEAANPLAATARTFSSSAATNGQNLLNYMHQESGNRK